MKKNNKTKSQIMLELSDFQPIKAFGVNEYSYDILCEYQGNEQAVLSLCDSKKRIIIRFSHPEQISKMNMIY
ncbi:MAG: hypothetical protein AB7F64_07900 [Gammaproteobacteria bacterium]